MKLVLSVIFVVRQMETFMFLFWSQALNMTEQILKNVSIN